MWLPHTLEANPVGPALAATLTRPLSRWLVLNAAFSVYCLPTQMGVCQAPFSGCASNNDVNYYWAPGTIIIMRHMVRSEGATLGASIKAQVQH